MTDALKRLRWALALSLGLNVFLIGFVSARWLQRRTDTSAHEVRHDRRDGMRSRWRHPSPEMRAQHEELSAARRQVADALAAEPFDRERLQRALEKLRTETGAGQALLHEQLLERASQGSHEERKALAQSRWFRGRRPPPADR